MQLFTVNSGLLFLGTMVLWVFTPMVMTPLWEKALYFGLFMLFFKFIVDHYRYKGPETPASQGFWLSGIAWWCIALFFLVDLWNVYPANTRFIRLHSHQGAQFYLFENQQQSTGVMVRIRRSWLPYYTTVFEKKGISPYELVFLPQPQAMRLIWPTGEQTISLQSAF